LCCYIVFTLGCRGGAKTKYVERNFKVIRIDGILIVCFSLANQAFAERNGCLPTESKLPYKWPFAIDVLKRQYDALPSQRLLAFQSQYIENLGLNMKLMLFGQAGYLTTDPKNIEAVLSTRFEDFGLGSRREGLPPLLGEGIFTQDGRAWKHSRETLRRQFVRMQYQNTRVFEKHVNDLISKLSDSSGVVDLQPHFFRYTLSTTTSLIFGEPPDVLGDTEQSVIDQDTFASSFDYASMVCAIRWRLADLCWLYAPSEFKKSCDDVKAYAAYVVALALKDLAQNGKEAALTRHPFVVDLYRDLKDASRVRDQLVHVLISGRDTTACLMSWTL
jgi:cytochrome P450